MMTLKDLKAKLNRMDDDILDEVIVAVQYIDSENTAIRHIMKLSQSC